MKHRNYRVKVTEKHSDYVWIVATSEEEAKRLAHAESQCEFECLYDCEVICSEELGITEDVLDGK